MAGFPPNIIAAAQASNVKWGVPASVSLAQWAQESGWGRFMPLGSNNPFGIKAAPGEPYIECPTHEDINGRYVATVARFRKFKTITDAFMEHAQLLATNSVYASAMAVKSNPEEFAQELTRRYATDPHYGEELIALMHQFGLEKYDA